MTEYDELDTLVKAEEELTEVTSWYYEISEEELRTGETWFTSHDLMTLERAREILHGLIGKQYLRTRLVQDTLFNTSEYSEQPTGYPEFGGYGAEIPSINQSKFCGCGCNCH